MKTNAVKADAVPLTVDLDGTLLRHDSMWYMSALAAGNFDFFMPFTLLRGRANFKHYLASRYTLDFDALPWNANVIRIMSEARAEGRPVWLVTAANERLAERVCGRFGFDGFKGSTRTLNLRGAAKADWLESQFGMRGFDYMGDSSVDLPVWARSRVAWVASTFRGIDKVRDVCPDVRVFVR